MPENTHLQTKVTHARVRWLVRNATDAHMLSNKLRLNDEQHMTCRFACTAVQWGLCKHPHSFRPPAEQLPLRIWCTETLKAEVTGISSKSTNLEAIHLKTSMQ